jgi:hypothetical protein
MMINITFILNQEARTVSFDSTNYLEDLIDYIIDNYSLEKTSVIKILETAGLYSGKESLEECLFTVENLLAKPINLDMTQNNNKQESKHTHSDKLTNDLMDAICQENPDYNEIRKILGRKIYLNLNIADFTDRMLNILQVAIRGNRTITSLIWEGDDADIEQPKIKQYKEEIASVIDQNDQLQWASLLGSALENTPPQDITVENPGILDQDNFKNFQFQNYNTTKLIPFKLRIALNPETYGNEIETVGDVICILNKKYAFDPYNPPLQHAKAYLLTKNIIDNSNQAIIAKILEILLSGESEPLRKNKLTELLSQIENPKSRQEIYDWCKNLSKENMEIQFSQYKLGLRSQYRLSTEAQVTLYPLSHQNIHDIRLLFFVRDLEIELARRHMQPAPTIADTDAPIGVYTRFRQQLSDANKYIPFEDDSVGALSKSQIESPRYKFLTQKGYPEFYDNILESHGGTLQDKIIELCECYLKAKSGISLTTKEISLVVELKSKMQTSPLSGTQILQAFDQLLLTLHDNHHQISEELLSLSYCIDAIFKEDRIALVAETFITKQDQLEVTPIPQLTTTAVNERKEVEIETAAVRGVSEAESASAVGWFKPKVEVPAAPTPLSSSNPSNQPTVMD